MAAVFDRRRPDLEQGVFETMLVLDGCPVELDAHLARLETSLAVLFPTQTPPPLDVPGVMGPYASSTPGTSGDTGSGRLRITVAPDGVGRLAGRASLRPIDRGGVSSHSSVALRSLPLPGGLGAHKWADRSLLDEAQAELPEGTLPLIVDGDGTVLEASRANVFAVRDGALFTPPLDGRILPGVTRARVLELAVAAGLETHESELQQDDLLAADEVFLTGSVRGIERAHSLDGTALGAGGEVASDLAAELRRSWAAVQVG